MLVLKKITTLPLLGFLIFLSVKNTHTLADSVYAIPQHTGSIVKVYDILEGYEEGKLEYRATYSLTAGSPADITIDIQSHVLFVTSESSNVIELINAKTFLPKGFVTAEGASDLAGVILSYPDAETTHLFTVERGTNELYAYEWDASIKSLTPITPEPNEPGNPNYGNEVPYYLLEPENPGSDPDVFACGLALDGDTGLLYVSQFNVGGYFSNIVYVYDTQDFETDYFPHVRTIDLGEHEGQDNYAVDIDIDSENGWLYAGGYNHYGNSHNNLIRFDLEEDDPDAPGYGGYIKDIGAGVIGLAVSPGTRFVYCTTYNSWLEVWDTTDLPLIGWTRIDAEEVESGAGVCVADVDYVRPFDIDKVDDVSGCVVPRAGEEITYTISYEYQWTEPGDPNVWNFTGIVITDHLPREVDFILAEPDIGDYDEGSHQYIWEIDPESFGEPNSIEILVKINNKVMPGEQIENSVVEIISSIWGQEYRATVEIETMICPCADYGVIIYVDENADAEGNGSSWEDAYTKLENALNIAFPCDEVWVAEGTYEPTEEPNMVNYVGVYGGFDGSESHCYERDWSDYETIICADINDDDDLTKGFNDPDRNTADNLDYALIANDAIKWAVLDGFTLRRGRLGGIYCNESSVLVEHNKIIDSEIGIYCEKTETPVIRNNWIYDNGTGIYMDNPKSVGVIKNNTIVYNETVGVLVESGSKPLISNCIFWGCSEPNDMTGCYATYSCIEYPNHFWDNSDDPNNPNSDPNNPIDLGIGLGNISGDPNNPLFVGADNNDYHLDPNSPCIDAGIRGDYIGDRDIDKEFRVINEVDMGADEYCDGSISNEVDFNNDGTVNYIDYAEFAGVWLIDDNDPNWNEGRYDLLSDYVVDVYDLRIFAENWLWMASWKMKTLPMKSYMMGAGGGGIGGMSSVVNEQDGRVVGYHTESLKVEPTIEEQIAHAKEVIDRLEKIWEEDEEVGNTIGEDDWDEFMKKIYEWLNELEASQNI